MEVIGDLLARARAWAGITPPTPGTIVGAHLREGSDDRLHPRPIERGSRQAAVEHHRGLALAHADEVHFASVHGDEATERWIPTGIAVHRQALVEQTSTGQEGQTAQEAAARAHDGGPGSKFTCGLLG